jgi:hypothetical protein
MGCISVGRLEDKIYKQEEILENLIQSASQFEEDFQDYNNGLVNQHKEKMK